MKNVLRVMFMEQSAAIRERMSELIMESIHDAEIHHAERPDEALLKLQTTKPHVLFLDSNFRVPVLPEFIASAKAVQPYLHVVVLYIQQNMALHEKCKAAGAAEFLDKYEEFDLVAARLIKFRQNRNQ